MLRMGGVTENTLEWNVSAPLAAPPFYLLRLPPRPRPSDPPPLKWSDLSYVFDSQEGHNGKEALQS